MSGLVSVIIFVGIFFLFIKRSLKMNASSEQKSQFAPTRRANAKPSAPKYTNYKPHGDIVSVSRDMGDKKNSSVLCDDKANDWLAQQLRDEHKAFKVTSEMFDLKIEHASHCDARLLEQFHRRNCQAGGVDLANGSTARKAPGNS